MSSYLKLFQDFLQKKESAPDKDVKRRKSSFSAPEDDDEESETLPTSDDSPDNNKMEHSYTRDTSSRPTSTTAANAGNELLSGLAPARTILVRRPPLCPSCHVQPAHEEQHECDDANQAQVPGYNEISSKEAMNECARIAKYVKNNNADDDDWESRINQSGWSNMQRTLFAKVVRILDNDQLGRLSGIGRQNEAMQRRVVVDKSAARMRKVLASVAWDGRLTQWLHCLLMDCLPSTYMASYLDVLQTLKSKLPTLMDKMLFGRPMNVSQELLAPVMKRQWEPVLNPKMRKLAQNAVIVALPSLPSTGQMPTRMQKWYTNLASITQTVQVTLPSANGQITRQPFEEIAEQIVSLTRVKIQQLRNENPSRSIILIGFNAGAAMALQVAMSENIACVVCMGFAYNTLNGVRGAPDDRILDIKLPILFVIGQNAARSSTEEIESLREKMVSETSLVVVGCADDELRVPKSRRKIESVTQAMVDAMVVDEVYEFIKKTLNNPPGPRIPTSITSAVKQSKQIAALQGAAGDGKTPLGQQRKRKQDAISNNNNSSVIDPELTPPAKSKYVPHSKLSDVGRPRTRPLNTTTSTTTTTPKTTQILTSTPLGGGGKQLQKSALSAHAITNEDLNLAIQSILGDSNEHDSSANTSNDSQKLVTNFELVAQSKSTPIKTSLINPLQKQQPTIISSSGVLAGSSTALGTKIKMIPSNQFVQLKPPLQSQSKIYTIKTTSAMQGASLVSVSNPAAAATIGSIVATPTIGGASIASAAVQQQIFTLKSPNGQTTQFVTAAPAAAQRKYTVVKNATGGTTLQLTSPSGAAKVGGGVDLSNIIDMPIIFADSDGNLSDVTAGTSTDAAKVQLGAGLKPIISSSSSGVGQLIISQKIIKEATGTPTKPGTFVLNKPGTTIVQQTTPHTVVSSSGNNNNKPNKVVFINRNTMKPCPNIIARSNVAQQLPKYTKVVVTNPKTAATTLVPRPGTQIISSAGTSGLVGSGGSPIVTSVKQLNLQALKTVTAGSSLSASSSSTAILNMPTKSLQQFQIISSNNVGVTSTTSNISSSSPPQQIRNIVVKPGGLKQIPPHLKTQLLNRNLTVRKLVNIVPATNSTAGSPTSSVTIAPVTTAAVQLDSPSAAAAIQTAPKIITLNPINRSSSQSKGGD